MHLALLKPRTWHRCCSLFLCTPVQIACFPGPPTAPPLLTFVNQAPSRRADFTGLLLFDTWHELRHPKGEGIPRAIWIGFCVAALTVSSLNYYWFSLMLRSLRQVYLKGRTWTDISQGKNE
jgi:hypothetical protein